LRIRRNVGVSRGHELRYGAGMQIADPDGNLMRLASAIDV
jgi:hypothetical protein